MSCHAREAECRPTLIVARVHRCPCIEQGAHCEHLAEDGRAHERGKAIKTAPDQLQLGRAVACLRCLAERTDELFAGLVHMFFERARKVDIVAEIDGLLQDIRTESVNDPAQDDAGALSCVYRRVEPDGALMILMGKGEQLVVACADGIMNRSTSEVAARANQVGSDLGERLEILDPLAVRRHHDGREALCLPCEHVCSVLDQEVDRLWAVTSVGEAV
mmetsp:Transcript_42179/g.111424  ORF Transcript_42179/g.111424 Transcript_42179/m.111424 type:complete len:218 (-) Transcript_42179:555-1208(-)